MWNQLTNQLTNWLTLLTSILRTTICNIIVRFYGDSFCDVTYTWRLWGLYNFTNVQILVIISTLWLLGSNLFPSKKLSVLLLKKEGQKSLPKGDQKKTTFCEKKNTKRDQFFTKKKTKMGICLFCGKFRARSGMCFHKTKIITQITTNTEKTGQYSP